MTDPMELVGRLEGRADAIIGRDGYEPSATLMREAAAALRDLTERLADANQSVCAFCAPWAVTYARDHGLPEGSLFADHYDTLEKAGARMVSFTRWLPSAPNQAEEAGE